MDKMETLDKRGGGTLLSFEFLLTSLMLKTKVKVSEYMNATSTWTGENILSNAERKEWLTLWKSSINVKESLFHFVVGKTIWPNA